MATLDGPPTIEEVIQLTRSELTEQDGDADDPDPIRECGRAALSLLPRDADICLQLAYQHLHDVPYKEVKTCWRRLYTDAALHKILRIAEAREERVCRDSVTTDEVEERDWVAEVVRLLDMALILTGAPRREEVAELWFGALKCVVDREEHGEERPTKRRRLEDTSLPRKTAQIPERFPLTLTTLPSLHWPIPRVPAPSLSAFQSKIASPETQAPVILEGTIDHWPALSERPWKSPEYLLENTLGGRRLVPVEIGRSYTDQGWGQKIMTFREFMDEYMLQNPGEQSAPAKVPKGGIGEGAEGVSNKPESFTDRIHNATSNPSAKPKSKTGYLAQHDLFAQIPSLRSDICIPDYCYAELAPQTTNPSHVKPVSKLEEPLLNAWFGPAGTISPLHTDPYHNILAQVVGYKYIRLYAPDQTQHLHPRGVDENGIDMSNTSFVDLDRAMVAFPEISPWGQAHHSLDNLGGYQFAKEFEEQFPGFREAQYVEGLLAPGDCLYIPTGWWHYVTSLTPSFSVSFWFN